jgi:hypothetical protein
MMCSAETLGGRIGLSLKLGIGRRNTRRRRKGKGARADTTTDEEADEEAKLLDAFCEMNSVSTGTVSRFLAGTHVRPDRFAALEAAAMEIDPASFSSCANAMANTVLVAR